MYKVYVKTDEIGRIISVNSDAFLPDTDGWTQIDEGDGDKFMHAQGNYFPLSIITIEGVYRYILVGGKAVERTAEEIQADIDAIPPAPPDPITTISNLILDLSRQNQIYADLIKEMSNIVRL